MAEYKCGNCIHADVCEESETLVGFSRENNAYCGMFLNSADVAPVRHGRWLDVQEKRLFGDHYFLCSNCKSRNGTMIPFNYCFNCGARMDLEHAQKGGDEG